ncbi:MAG: SET domain-containing protein-lysine N-methyltransferase [Candidatus Falkowbacteria bacterium]
MDNIFIKKSKINNKGVFASHDFKKGDVVLLWKPKVISKEEFEKLTKKNNNYLVEQDGNYFLMQPPEKFVNHSCDPNTRALNKSDIAIRDIKTGEEVTSSYLSSGSNCNCGSKNCKGKIN